MGHRPQSVMAGKEREETEMESASKEESLEPRNCWDANTFLYLSYIVVKYAIRWISESETKKMSIAFSM